METKKWLIGWLMLCLLSGFARPAAAGDTTETAAATKPAAENDERQSLLKKFLDDEKKIWTAALRWKWRDWALCGSVLAITGFLIANDEGIYKYFKDYQKDYAWVDRVSPEITKLGDGLIDAGVAGMFLINGLIFKNEKARETGLLALQTLVHTAIFIQTCKHLFGRQRPEWDDGVDGWHGPAGFLDRYSGNLWGRYDSFPSGHTITAWGLATVIALQYKENLAVPIACYTLATLAGLSRITEDKHWFSDVFVGAALGYFIARMVVRNQNQRLQLSPTFSGNGLGLSLRYEF